MRFKVGTVLLAGCIVLGACSSSKPTTTATASSTTAAPTTTVGTTTTTIDVKALGQQVLTIINTNEARITADKAKPGTTGFADIAASFSAAAQQLQNLTYPADAQSDAKALSAILVKLSADASQAAQPDALLGDIAQNLTNDEGTELADSDALRHDLGLPPSGS